MQHLRKMFSGVSSSPHEPEYAVSSHHKSSHSSSSEKKPSRAHVSAGARPKSSPTSGGNAPRVGCSSSYVFVFHTDQVQNDINVK